MFGSNYANHPELLMQSLQEMSAQYEEFFHNSEGILIRKLQTLYIKIFGVPEIGFQLRAKYYQKAMKLVSADPKHILDIGSGIGSYVFDLSKRFPHAMVTGWEIDNFKLMSSRRLSQEFGAKNVNFQYGDIERSVRTAQKYDLIITIDVLEHIQNYRQALKHIYAILAPGGYVYIHTPQEKQRRFFATLQSWSHEDHVREGFNPHDFLQELSRLGFRVVSTDYTFGNVGAFAWEVDHLLLSYNRYLTAIFYPALYAICLMDLLIKNTQGLGIAILVKKTS